MSTLPTPAVYAAISAVMSDMGKEGISKSRKNVQQNYSFRGIDDMYNALNGSLVANKLLMLPRVLAREKDERATKGGGAIFYTTMDVEYDLIAVSDGSLHTVRTVGEAMDSADKSSNKAMSAAYKYAALQVFCIPTEGDNDADATTHEPAPKAAPANGAPAKAESGAAAAALDWTERFIAKAQEEKDSKQLADMQHRQKDKLAIMRAKYPEYADRIDKACAAHLEKIDPLDDSIIF